MEKSERIFTDALLKTGIGQIERPKKESTA